ncbi:O-antigen ligase family protein, partial [Mycobacterium tuberculosis]
ALGNRKGPGWRGAVALGLPVLLVLTVLASGSRAGTAAIVLALVLGPLAVRENIRRLLAGLPRWTAPALIASALLLVTASVAVSFTSGRADSINRAMGGQVTEDMRARALPTVLTITRDYFPVGIGIGGFDPVFRRYEPFDLLKPTYFNQAHDDLLAALLEGGLLGLLVLVAAIIWWLRSSFIVWRSIGRHDDALGPI